MFGQRRTLVEHSISMFPFFLPVIVFPFLLLPFTPLGTLSLSVSLAGWGMLFTAKWPLIKQGQMRSFGPPNLDVKGRRRYYWGYAIVCVGVFGMLYSRFG